MVPDKKLHLDIIYSILSTSDQYGLALQCVKGAKDSIKHQRLLRISNHSITALAAYHYKLFENAVNTVPARIIPAATITGFEFFDAGSIRVATLQVLLTKKIKNIFSSF